MSFSELEQQRIEKIVGGYCKQRVPKHVQYQIKLIYKIRGNDVKIIETRQHWQDKKLWTETPIARLQYIVESKKWKIYWQRANGKWLLYEAFKPVNDLKKVIEEIENDPYHVFWG